jgi:hypothetical protein
MKLKTDCPTRKNPTSSDLANETIIPCLLVCHQKQSVNNAQTYLCELLHCLLGEKKEDGRIKERKKGRMKERIGKGSLVTG